MHKVKVSHELCDAVLLQAKTGASPVREGAEAAYGQQPQSANRQRQHNRIPTQPRWLKLSLSSKRFRTVLGISLAAALICAGSIVGWSLSSEQALNEPQDTQAPEENTTNESHEATIPESPANTTQTPAVATPAAGPATPGQKAITITLNDDFDWGSYSGIAYDPATDRFLEPWTWAGFKFAFNPVCTGDDIDTITYELEGDRGYFEMIAAVDSSSRPTFKEGNPYGATPGNSYHYTKSISLDYDKQEFNPGGVIYSIYHHFPLSEEENDLMLNGDQAEQLNCSIAQSAAQEMLRHRLKVTFLFTDGSTETRTYRISPVADFAERFKSHFEAIMKPGGTPNNPELYVITQVED